MENNQLVLPEVYHFNQYSACRLVHIMSRDKSFAMNWHSHSFYHSNYILSGTVNAYVAGEKTVATAGMLLILPPGIPHRIETDTGYTQIGLDIQQTVADNRCFKLMKDIFGEQVSTHSMNYFKEKFRELYIDYNNISELNKLELINFCEKILLKAMENARGNTNTKFHQSVIKELDSEQLSGLSVERMCKLLFISKTHLERLMKRDFGCTAKQYIDSKRLEKAYYYLNQTDMQVEQIARVIGFYDSAHFITFFKRKTGNTPTFFRKNMK